MQNNQLCVLIIKLPKLLSECSAQSDLPRFPFIYSLTDSDFHKLIVQKNLPQLLFSLQFFPVFFLFQSFCTLYIKKMIAPAMWTVGLPKNTDIQEPTLRMEQIHKQNQCFYCPASDDPFYFLICHCHTLFLSQILLHQCPLFCI